MPEKPVNPSGKHNHWKSDEDVHRYQDDLPSTPSWQPLEPESTANEDLASILQTEFKGRQGAEARGGLSSQPSNWPASNRQDESQDQIFSSQNQAAELAALAATVFDTTFYLVPRSNEHYLLGEMTQALRDWMPVLCEIYGWELGLISIRPDYLKWTLLDFPESLTQKMLAVVRQWTSQRIHKHFPALQADPVEHDFWAPGYLVDTQNRDFPTQVLIANVSRNRA